MLNIFGCLKSPINLSAIYIDNWVFHLHYKATVITLIAFTLLVTYGQYIGNPIDCIFVGISHKNLNSYCSIKSTFTLWNQQRREPGMEGPYPGVSHHTGKEEVKYHKYYKWVCFVLFFQAILFYTPRYLWKMWEGGRISMLVGDLNCAIVKEDGKPDRKKPLAEYFVSNLHTHNVYAMHFFICEALNLINVVGQFYFMDYFLDGHFSTYGSDVIRFAQMETEDRVDPMSRVFPKVTKCTFHSYGPSGSVQVYDGLCILPLNGLNEKIFVFLWFWFVFLSVLTGLNLLYRAVVILTPQVRMYLLRARSHSAPQDQIRAIHRKCQIGDWFLLYQLSNNIDPLIYKDLMADLAKRLEGKETV